MQSTYNSSLDIIVNRVTMQAVNSFHTLVTYLEMLHQADEAFVTESYHLLRILDIRKVVVKEIHGGFRSARVLRTNFVSLVSPIEFDLVIVDMSNYFFPI